jgi:hypothetical protein
MGLLNGTFFLGRSQFRACSAPRDASRSECPLPTSQHNSCRSCWFINEFSTRCLTAVLPSGTIRDPSKNLWMQNLPGAKASCCPEDVAPGVFSPFHFSNSLTDRFHLPYDIKMDDSLCHWQQCLLAKCNAKFAFRIRIIRKTSSTYFSNL